MVSARDTQAALPLPAIAADMPLLDHGIDARRLGQFDRRDGLLARNTRLQPGDTLAIKVWRSGLDGGPPSWAAFDVPYRKAMRVLDALIFIAENRASDLAFRWYCGSKMCGTCAVRVNGREVLACWEAVEPAMTIEPLRNLAVIRDLVVDRVPFERRVEGFEPWLERAAPYAGFPEPLSHMDMANASKALDCIGCMACYSACPVVGLGDLTDFAGPAPLVQFAQTALDPRNDARKVARLLATSGIFNCVSCYKCEEACPAAIPIVSRVIEPLKARAAVLAPRMAHHALALRAVVALRGRVDPGELMLRVQGLRALGRLRRLARFLWRGKIKPLATLLRRRNAATAAAGRILGDKGGTQ
ncbi:MAG: succinate dehydrogenase/fumarate reductase iron-sulfur subunit [Proteobacteria bacterium]|nr:succinate dehydrogenase/fumarate reductase iron-sulfur subunit [Pseudomonadota bacterium]